MPGKLGWRLPKRSKKWCNKCKRKRRLKFFRLVERKGYGKQPDGYCLSCRRKNLTEHRASNLLKGLCFCGNVVVAGLTHCEVCRARERKREASYKERCFEHYGKFCFCCGERRKEFLTLDHENNDGSEHKRKIRRRTIWRWLVKNGFPKGFRIACWNCNCSRGVYGYCPHDKEVS